MSPLDRHLRERQRVGDWIVCFDCELAEAPWPEVLNRWVPRLAPGLIASAGHGLIRASPAVRSLGDDRGLIAFVHAVIAPRAYRNLLPYLSESAACLVVR
jgi:hypothetical protein